MPKMTKTHSDLKLKLAGLSSLVLVAILATLLMYSWGLSHVTIAASLLLLLYCLGLWARYLWLLVSNPLRQMTSYTQSLAEGETQTKLLLESTLMSDLLSEIEHLSRVGRQTQQHQLSISMLFKALYDTSAQAVCVFSADKRLSYANTTAIRLPEISLLLGAKAEDLGFVFTEQGIKHGYFDTAWQIESIEYRLFEQNYWLFFAYDISAQIQQTELNIQNNMVRVLSHELRNTLTPISSMADTLLNMPHLSETQVRQVLDRVKNRADSLLQFVQRFASVGQMPEAHACWFVAHELVEQASTILASDTQLKWVGETRCFGDKSLLSQAFINLIKNAREASGNSNDVIQVAFFSRVGMQHLQVKDNGSGFANLANVFTPFYTTKAQGSGLGLTFVNAVMLKHGGKVRIENAKEGGALVELIWPSAQAEYSV